MRPSKPDTGSRSGMVREPLEAILGPRHALPEPGRRIDLERLDGVCGETCTEGAGRPGLPTRLMAGLHILEHVTGLSDERVCAGWVESPYWQACLAASGTSGTRSRSSAAR